MRFTKGSWDLQPGYDMTFAAQCAAVTLGRGCVQALSVCRPMHHRGDSVGNDALDDTPTSPCPNVIRVKVTHFAGTPRSQPIFQLNEQADNDALSQQDAQYASLQSGMLTARISKSETDWAMEFLA